MINLSKNQPNKLQFAENTVKTSQKFVTISYDDLMLLVGTMVPMDLRDYQNMLHNIIDNYTSIEKLNQVLLQEITRGKLCTEIMSYETANAFSAE